jgi:hypothetical protein
MLQHNIHVLEQKYPAVFELIKLNTKYSNDYSLGTAKNDALTLKIHVRGKAFFLHSKYDPGREAAEFAIQNPPGECKHCIIYGFGFGYHIREILKLYPQVQISVYEGNLDIFKLAVEKVDISDILQDDRVMLHVDPNQFALLGFLQKDLSNPYCTLIIHNPSLLAMPTVMNDLKFLFEEFRIRSQSSKLNRELMNSNYNYNIENYHYPVDKLFGKFQNQSVILVAAGPSLDKNKEWLRMAKGKACIIVVNTALRILLSIGIVPDMVITIDPTPLVFKHLEELELDIPMIVLSTCWKGVLEQCKGLKFLALQQGFEPAEKYAKENDLQLVSTGGSVATAALDIAVKMGFSRIVFVGQDLAFSEQKSHAEGTTFCKDVEGSSNLRQIQGMYGKKLYTNSSLSMFKRWIEAKICEAKNIQYINATEGGAGIAGTIERTLKEVVERVIFKEVLIMENEFKKLIQ